MRFVPRRLSETADISRGDSSWPSFLKNALSVLIVFALGYLLLGALGELLARTIPDRWEAGIFGSPGFGIAVDEAEASGELARAEDIFKRLTVPADLRRLPYRLFLMPSREPNAFALPGGAVAVTQGLLDRVESETGLAMVLGHELGHHQERHTLKRLGRALVFGAAKALIFGRDTSSVVDASISIAESGYSRRQEREADAFGLKLVHDVFGSTEGSLEFLEMIESGDEAEELRWAAFLRSHPLSSTRVDTLRRLQAQLEAGEEH